jgi:hypothetical protein
MPEGSFTTIRGEKGRMEGGKEGRRQGGYTQQNTSMPEMVG